MGRRVRAKEQELSISETVSAQGGGAKSTDLSVQ